jgi:RNA polymerase sigma-70 factor (ECF subfamily)
MNQTGDMAGAFWEAAGGKGKPPAECQQALLTLWEAGRSAWPGVELPAVDFARHAGRSTARDPGALGRLRGSDLYLACACARGDATAHRLFDERFMANVGDFVARINASRTFADEVRQVLRERLLLGGAQRPPRIADYRGVGALGGWLRTVASRTALELLERRGKERPSAYVDEGAGAPIPSGDPEVDYLKSRHRSDFEEAFAESLGDLEDDDRALLKLHFLDGVSLTALAKMQGVDKSTLSRRLSRCRELILAETRRKLGERLGVDGSELESVMNALGSRVEITLGRLLGK